MESHSLYLHFPFCKSRCAYCDFFSSTGCEEQMPAYWESVRHEANLVGRAGGRPELVSVYFGGGTPSLAEAGDVAKTMDVIRAAFRLQISTEVTMEANPGTVDAGSLAGFRAAGINRISLGVQSAHAEELRMMGRAHTWPDAETAVACARQAGFENLSLDLIYGLPGQSLASWVHSLKSVIALEPEHMSLYALTLGRGTQFMQAVRRGDLPKPDEDLTADMYLYAEQSLEAAGYRHYEISNWAKSNPRESASLFPAYGSRHNLQYWLNLPYVGIGAGAHGYAAGRRYSNLRSIDGYIQRIREGKPRRFPLSTATTISKKRTRIDEMRETIWLGLRLVEAGISDADYRRRFGVGLRDAFPREVEGLIAKGLLEWSADSDRLRLPPSARFISNLVFREFV
jgi:oxygen-independent coproporphyrinogen III oxidase